jgi:hypothetical protein
MKHFISIVLFFLVNGCASAQKFSISADAQLAVPQGDYKVTNPDAGYGLRAAFFYMPTPPVPLKVGIELGIQEKARATDYFSGYSYGYYDEFKVSAASNIFSLMVVTRFQVAKYQKLKPFVDLAAGWNVFYSTVNVERLTFYSPYPDTYGNTSKAHWAMTYGAAAGVDISLNKRDDLGLEIKCAYLIGNNSVYLTDPYIDNNANVTFVEKNSRTNMLIPQAGLRISIH